MYTLLRRLFWSLLGLAALYLILFSIDILTTPATTPDETERTLAYAAAHDKELPPHAFYEDGCTAFPDRLPGHNFYDACLNHDIAYWLGGTEEERTEANQALADAVRTTGPLGPLLAPIVYTAVQYGGNNWISYRLGSEWGYGWH